MNQTRRNSLLDLQDLLPSWTLTLQSERKADSTIEQYGIAVRMFIRWCNEHGHTPALDRRLVQGFIANAMANGMAPTTATLRLQALRSFSKWAAAEGEIDEDDLRGVKPPRQDEKLVEPFTDDEIRALLKACAGAGFRDRRDEMIVRLLAETGMRSGELLALTVDDVDVAKGLVTVRRTKSRRGRTSAFGPQTAAAVDRYLRARRRHFRAAAPEFILGGNNLGSLSYHGLRDALLARAVDAGVKNFRLHRLRHTAATRWLSAGGSEGGAMQTMGWKSPAMLHRYVRATASDRAALEARALNLGDF